MSQTTVDRESSEHSRCDLNVYTANADRTKLEAVRVVQSCLSTFVWHLSAVLTLHTLCILILYMCDCRGVSKLALLTLSLNLKIKKLNVGRCLTVKDMHRVLSNACDFEYNCDLGYNQWQTVGNKTSGCNLSCKHIAANMWTAVQHLPLFW